MQLLPSKRLLTFLVVSALVLNVASAAAMLEGKQLVAALAGGGYNIVMRHASSSETPPTRDDILAPGNIGHEPQLDENGRTSARAMGEALRHLKIPIGKVLSSPAYRALETARLAQLPDPHTYDDLAEAGRNADRAASFRAQVALLPDAGTNTVIITHAANIADAAREEGKDLAPGEALIYRPDGHGKVVLVARIKIEDWPKLPAP